MGQHAHQPIYLVTHLQPLPVKVKIESVRARLDRLGVGGGATGNANEFNRRKSLFECVLDTRRRPSALMRSQSLEGIKDKLQLLSERPGAAEQEGKEGNMAAICDLADDLRDAIVDYQVSGDI